MNEREFILKCELYDWNEEGDCLADIVLADGELEIKQLKVEREHNGGVAVRMPRWMGPQWQYPDISWGEVRKNVLVYYAQALPQRPPLKPKPTPPPKAKGKVISAKPKRQVPPPPKPAVKPAPTVAIRAKFYGKQAAQNIVADVSYQGETLVELGKANIFYLVGAETYVQLPTPTLQCCQACGVDADRLKAAVKAHLYSLLWDALESDGFDEFYITLRKPVRSNQFFADFSISGDTRRFVGYRIKERETGNCVALLPVGCPPWQDGRYSWGQIQDGLLAEFDQFRQGEDYIKGVLRDTTAQYGRSPVTRGAGSRRPAGLTSRAGAGIDKNQPGEGQSWPRFEFGAEHHCIDVSGYMEARPERYSKNKIPQGRFFVLAHYDRGNQSRPRVSVNIPNELKKKHNAAWLHWANQVVDADFRRVVLGEKGGGFVDPNVKMNFGGGNILVLTQMSFQLEANDPVYKDYVIKENEEGRCFCHSDGVKWEHPTLSWEALSELAVTHYRRYRRESGIRQRALFADAPTFPDWLRSETSRELMTLWRMTDGVAAAGQPEFVELTEYGRIKNRLDSGLGHVPQGVFRERKNMRAGNLYAGTLVQNLEDGEVADRGRRVGNLQIGITEWASKLGYLSQTMIQDLMRGGYIDLSGVRHMTGDKLSNILSTMVQYTLVMPGEFRLPEAPKRMLGMGHLYYILGQEGNKMLYALDRSPERYNAFLLFQNETVVKRRLSVNQWIIHWLCAHPEEVQGEYKTDWKIQRKGAEFATVRIYGSVTCNGETLIAESVRRTDSSLQEKMDRECVEKLVRFMEIFDCSDELYNSREQIYYPSRPILTYICEDDDHMHEIHQLLAPVLAEKSQGDNPQEVWFTTDLRMFNYNMARRRFFVEDEEGQLVRLDVAQRLDIPPEPESDTSAEQLDDFIEIEILEELEELEELEKIELPV